MNQERVLLIDGHALLYRAYHAFPNLTDPTGMLVNAAYGFARILLKAISDFEPEYIALAFDTRGPTFRTEVYAEYKANRPPTPDDFIPQVAVARDLIDTLNIPQFALSEYEADDVIGTIARTVEKKYLPSQLSTIILTGDKDLLQLVTDQTHVWLPGSKYRQELEYGPDEVRAKMHVSPDQIVDLKGLMGDASDNIPGVKGVGQKTASKLLAQYQTVHGVYAAIDELAKHPEKKAQHPLLKGALLSKLVRDRDQALMSRELARIKTDVALDFDLQDCRTSVFDKEAVIEWLDRYGFESLKKLLPHDAFEKSVQDSLF